MNLLDAILTIEMGGTEWEVLQAYSLIVQQGAHAHLQGSYGRNVDAIIKGGFLNPDGTITEKGELLQ